MTAGGTIAETRADGVTPAQARRAALTALAASSIEWYDFFIYGTAAALVFSQHFFPSASPVAGVLAAFATVAAGFVARPIGGILFGHFGDKIGRKKMLVGALALMGVGTTLIGVMPTYQMIGVAAPILLVVLRCVQGFAVGGQWGGAMLVATETAPPGKRGLYGSFAQLGVPVGLIAGNGIFLIASGVMAPEAFESWGWRVPFLLSIVMLGLAIFVHKRLEETPAFRHAEEKRKSGPRRSPVLEVIRTQPKQILLASGSFLVVNSSFYVMVTGVLDYGTRNLGMSENTVLSAVLISNAAQIIVVPAFSALSDRIGRRKTYAIGAVLLGTWAFPMFLLIDTGQFPMMVLGLVGGATFLSIMYGPQAAMFAEMFSPEVRYSGASLGYQLTAVVGGLAPGLMVVLIEVTKTSMSVSVYIAVLAAIALFCLWHIRPASDTEPQPAQ